MFRDIIIPKNNEAEFIKVAAKLGFKKLYFLYDFEDYSKKNIQKPDLIKNNENLDLEIGFIVNQNNMNKALQQSKLLAVKSSDKDRFFIESKRIKLIYGFEELNKKDYLHQRASGLNHTICELAKKNNVAIGFPYSSLSNKSREFASLLMGRMIQNITLCQKYKVKTIISSFSENPFDMRSIYDITSFYTMLGMSGKNLKESLSLDL